MLNLAKAGAKRGSVLVLACCFFGAALTGHLPAAAATFYVDPANGNMSNPGSSAAPWSTLQAVFSAGLINTQEYANKNPGRLPFTVKNPNGPVHGGDTIVLRSGYHGEINVVSYYNTDYITIKAEAGQTPILGRLVLTAAAKWRFDGLTITREGAPAISRGFLAHFANSGTHGASSDIAIVNCRLHTKWDATGWSMTDWDTLSNDGIALRGTNMEARNNYLKNVNFGIDGGSHNLIKDNTIENFAGDGMRGWDYSVFEGNVVKNAYVVNGNHTDGFQSWSTGPGGVGTGEVVGVVLRGNTIINYTDPNQPFKASMQGIGLFDGMYRDWVIENNIVVVDFYHGIAVYGAINCRIVNNTVVRPFPGGTIDPWVRTVSHKNGTASSGNVIRNNIYGSSVGFSATDVGDHNLKVSANFETCFVDPARRDYHLKPGSAAIDAGSGVGAPTMDRDNAIRPRGSGWDIGAFEYQAGPSDTTPPAVALTAPSPGASVSGTSVAVGAAASDNVGVAGVQFRLDGANLGAEDLIPPYSVSWNTTSLPNGSHTLVAVARDAAGNAAASAAVAVTVANNTPPTIGNIADRATIEDTGTGAIAFTVGDAETAAGSLTVSGSSSNPVLVPASSIVFGGSGANRTVSVTPGANQSGVVTITVSVTDGAASASDLFVLTVNAVNDAPTIGNIADRATNEDTATGAIVFTVNAVNDAPTIGNIADRATNEDAPTGVIAFTVGDVETSAGSLTVSASSSNPVLVPSSSIVFGGSGSNRTVNVTPAANQNGTVGITVTVSDGLASSSDSFVLAVIAVNDAPVAQDLVYSTLKRRTVAITLTASDVEGAPLAYTVVSQPVHGTLSGTAPKVSYTPGGSFSGTDSFTFKAHDGAADSNVATVTLKIGRTAPVLASSLSAAPNPAPILEAVSFSGGASDEDGDVLGYAWNFGDGNGSSAANPKHGYSAPGAYEVSLTVTDEDGLRAAQTLSVSVVQGDSGGGDRDGDGVPDRIDPDNDNDGFTDAEENAAGTDPHAAGSTPVGAGSGGAPLPVGISAVLGKLNFALAGKDMLLIQGTVEMTAGWNSLDTTAKVDVLGVSREFLLNARGQGREGSDLLRLWLPGGRKGFQGGSVRFQLRLQRGSWAGQWESIGLVNAAGGAGQALDVRMVLVLGGKSFAGSAEAELTANQSATAAQFAYVAP